MKTQKTKKRKKGQKKQNKGKITGKEGGASKPIAEQENIIDELIWAFLVPGYDMKQDDFPEDFSCQQMDSEKKCNSWIPCEWKEKEKNCLVKTRLKESSQPCKGDLPFLYGQTNCSLDSFFANTKCKGMQRLFTEISGTIGNGQLFMSICDEKGLNATRYEITFRIAVLTPNEVLEVTLPDVEGNAKEDLESMCNQYGVIQQVYFIIVTHDNITVNPPPKRIEVWIGDTWLGHFHETKNSRVWVRQVY